MDEDLTVVSVSDPEYLRHVRALAYSLKRNFPSAQLYLHLINTEPEQQRDLAIAFPKVEMGVETRSFDSLEEKRVYCAGSRARVMSNLLEWGKPLLLYLDADTIVRGNLARLIALIRSHDLVALKRRNKKDEHLRYATGVVGIRASQSSKVFLRKWADLIDRDPWFWFHEQLYFSKALEQMDGRIDFHSLPKRFIDWHYRLFSPIWVGKGSRKHEERIYVLAEDYYYRDVKGISGFDMKARITALGLARLVPRMLQKLQPRRSRRRLKLQSRRGVH